MTEGTYLYTAFIDVLGYREHLEKDRRTGTLEFQQKLSNALNLFKSVNEAVFKVQAISDTVILTCANHGEFGEFLGLLRRVFVSFLDEGLFVRGALAYSRHFQSNHLTYSHAIARAYEIESRIALYPRIVIDENIVRMHETSTSIPSVLRSGFICEQNGVYFVEIITSENWAAVYESAKALYERDRDLLRKNESAFVKHVMFERYLLGSPHAKAGAAAYCHTPQPT